MKIVLKENLNVAFTTDADVEYADYPSDNCILKVSGSSVIEIIRNGGLMAAVDVSKLSATKIEPNAEVPFSGTVNDAVKLLGTSFFFRNSVSISGQVLTKDFLLEVAKGNVPGHSLLRKFGKNGDISTGSVPETVWGGGDLYEGLNPTAASITEIVSSLSADTNGTGTGAYTVEIFGLDEDYVEQSEVVELNGLTPVSTSNQYLRVNRAIVRSAGSGGANAGIISAIHVDDSIEMITIEVGKNQSALAAYTIPAGKTAYFISQYAAANRVTGNTASTYANFELVIRPFGEVFQVKDFAGASSDNNDSQEYYYAQPISEKSDMRIDVTYVSENNTNVSAHFILILVDN